MLEDAIGVGGLTAREAAIMEHLMEGMPNRKIAECLEVSEASVMYDRISIYKKLNVKFASEAIRAWQRLKAGGPINLEALTKTDVSVLEVIANGCMTDRALAEHFGVAQQSIHIHMKRYSEETEAKIQALQDQAKKASADAKLRIDARIAEIRADQKQRLAKLEQARKLAQEALRP